MMQFPAFVLLWAVSIALGWAAPASPLITPAPTADEVQLRQRQDSINLGSLAGVLITAVPPSLLSLAETNLPALSRLLWSEFLDDNTPSWFTALPTDVQQYLSGQFGPSTAASNSATASTASTSVSSSSPLLPESSATRTSAPTASTTSATSQLDEPQQDDHKHGLPLWAKVLIGVLVPLFVLGLIALVLLCCWRRRLRRRRAARAQSRTPTPAFISSSHRSRPHENQHSPLRGGYLSHPNTNRHSRRISSNSDGFRNSVGGPSYENIPPPPVTGTHARNSRQSSESLQLFKEAHDPLRHSYDNVASLPPPPRSPERSREFNHQGSPVASHSVPAPNHNGGTMNKVERPSPFFNQGIYAGSFNPYSNPLRMEDDSPFEDPQTPYTAGHVGGHESSWPMDADGQSTDRRQSIPRKPLPHSVYDRCPYYVRRCLLSIACPQFPCSRFSILHQ
ncbi:hypothetical protein P280DRAFT_505019 [Massarina eburnea CBS 473.64]|uniref:Mid2 domain-containing protein n=1 Tax=Massarina eburnea CBS 473.64 TaxID=1395130 RepID=A0A6A6S9B4_9PLEO|nr:hypothetical protein P280DRAFT_505019 [Massarina eburnea CBS 473.64]